MFLSLIDTTVGINWNQLAIVLPIIVVFVGAATAYLRLFVKGELLTFQTNLLGKIREEYAQKTHVDAAALLAKAQVDAAALLASSQSSGSVLLVKTEIGELARRITKIENNNYKQEYIWGAKT